MDEHPFITLVGSDARMFIQWKGTEVCMDFHCPCRPESEAFSAHFDGMFAYYVKCPHCGAVYEMGTQVIAKRLDSGDVPDIPPLEAVPR